MTGHTRRKCLRQGNRRKIIPINEQKKKNSSVGIFPSTSHTKLRIQQCTKKNSKKLRIKKGRMVRKAQTLINQSSSHEISQSLRHQPCGHMATVMTEVSGNIHSAYMFLPALQVAYSNSPVDLEGN